MNERIEKLVEQAGFLNKDEESIEYFAELIVRECVKVVDDMADPEDSERYFWAIQNASQKIKEHFGVEE